MQNGRDRGQSMVDTTDGATSESMSPLDILRARILKQHVPLVKLRAMRAEACAMAVRLRQLERELAVTIEMLDSKIAQHEVEAGNDT